MNRENRYVVLKRSDLQKYIKREFRIQLQAVIETINQSRDFFEKKEPLQCVVVEKDWPEYEHVWELIRLRVENAEIPAETVQGVVDAPAVDAALRAFTDDATNDNAFFLVRTIMEACLPRAPENHSPAAQAGR